MRLISISTIEAGKLSEHISTLNAEGWIVDQISMSRWDYQKKGPVRDGVVKEWLIVCHREA